jgi:hypothetical protein
MRALALAMAFVLLSFAGARAQAAAPLQSPVTFTGCKVIDGSAGFSLIAPPGTAVLDVVYHVDAPAPLSAVRVALVVDGAALKTIDDAGAFAPGATIHRRFQIPPELLPLPTPPSCAAATVTFADGTTWINPAIGAGVGARLTQTPGSQIDVEQCHPGKRAIQQTQYAGKDAKGHAITTQSTRDDTTMSITFVDRAAHAATGVAFSLLANGIAVQRFEKEGTFSPGVPIEAAFEADVNIFPLHTLHPQCRVDSVTFADGTSWKNPAAETTPYGTVQTPGSHIDVLRCSTTGLSRAEQRSPPNYVYVTFRNTAAVPVSEVQFDFAVNGDKIAAEGVYGTFAPNVEIRKGIRLSPALVPLGTSLPSCLVSRVVYADGTTWTRPS